MNYLERACNAALRRCLPAGLCVLIRELLERGASADDVLTACRQAGATPHKLTGLAIEAEIEAVSAEIRARAN